MATTGELRAIIEELQLIDAGDAALYLGESTPVVYESHYSSQQEALGNASVGFDGVCSPSSCEHGSCR